MEAVAVFSVCFLMNFLGMYASTDPVPMAPKAVTADTGVKKTRVAETGQPGSLMEEFMALNDNKQ